MLDANLSSEIDTGTHIAPTQPSAERSLRAAPTRQRLPEATQLTP
jgi:hypothetical protein